MSNDTKNINNSPNSYYDENEKTIMILEDIKSNKQENNIIKIIRDTDFEGDSGHLLEYFFGQCKYGIIFHLIEIMLAKKINLNLLFDNNLWGKK